AGIRVFAGFCNGHADASAQPNLRSNVTTHVIEGLPIENSYSFTVSLSRYNDHPGKELWFFSGL
ncbi:MAG: hypothetical protein FWC56_04040, partial [Phycisphaerae bacterium]|nr:hypothetical protein [Phycisphaerae bacterium]